MNENGNKRALLKLISNVFNLKRNLVHIEMKQILINKKKLKQWKIGEKPCEVITNFFIFVGAPFCIATLLQQQSKSVAQGYSKE